MFYVYIRKKHYSRTVLRELNNISKQYDFFLDNKSIVRLFEEEFVQLDYYTSLLDINKSKHDRCERDVHSFLLDKKIVGVTKSSYDMHKLIIVFLLAYGFYYVL